MKKEGKGQYKKQAKIVRDTSFLLQLLTKKQII